MKISEVIKLAKHTLKSKGDIIKTNSWQGSNPLDDFVEVLNFTVKMQMEQTIEDMKKECNPKLPWADIHFEERVSGKPLNPPPSYKMWASGLEQYFTSNDVKFSHSYPERMWPKELMPKGYRFKTGDLNTLVELLKKDPTTRQAYLPIWFPEDLEAALQGERVPCTLGWHFIIRDNRLHCFYPIRSCDVARHLNNDLYFANRLSRWIADRIGIEKLGHLTFSCVSLHCFKGDLKWL